MIAPHEEPLRLLRELVPCPPPGIYDRQAMTMERYLALDAVRAGLVKDVLERSARYAEAQRVRVSEPSDSTDRGTAIHLAILEPERFDLVYGRLSPSYDGRTTAGKAEKASVVSRGLLPIKATTWEACQRLRELAWSNPLVRSLLEQAETEVTAVWETPHAGIYGAARADVLAREARTIVDLKSTEDASPRGFARHAAGYGYHLSAPWYMDGFTAAGVPVDFWWILALEVDEAAGHYDVAAYSIDELVVQRARERMDRGLRAWAGTRTRPELAGYPPNIMPLPLPAWAFLEDSKS